MEIARLLWNGRSQAVRLPKDFRFEGDRVFVKRGDVVREPREVFSEDFMQERGQPVGKEERDRPIG